MLSLLRPRRIPFRHRLTRSAVAVVYRYRNGQCELLLIKRAARDGDPWSGHMACPGGKIQTEDKSASDAAIRETLEEVGINLYKCARYKTRLPDLLTRQHNRLRPMVISPFVFLLTHEEPFAINHEVDEVVWVPLDFFKDDANKRDYTWELGSLKLNMPSYDYEGRRIWGLTYMMIQDLLTRKLEPPRS